MTLKTQQGCKGNVEGTPYNSEVKSSVNGHVFRQKTFPNCSIA